jgi:hypothetical protein
MTKLSAEAYAIVEGRHARTSPNLDTQLDNLEGLVKKTASQVEKFKK